jgi:hypothetical protein
MTTEISITESVQQVEVEVIDSPKVLSIDFQQIDTAQFASKSELKSAAYAESSSFATAAQGEKADSAVQPNAAVVFTTLTATTSVTTPIVGAASGSSTTGLDLNVNSKPQARIVEVGDGTRPLVINGGSAAGAQIAGISAPSVLALSAGGGNNIAFYTNGRVTTNQFTVSHTASAVNYVQVTGAATTGAPIVSAQGSDTNITLFYQTKGVGSHVFGTRGTTQQFRVADTGSAVNYVQVTGAVAGAAPVMSAQGSDTNIDLTLTPKGTGNVRFGIYTANMALVIQGYIEIKDAGGTIRKLAVVA